MSDQKIINQEKKKHFQNQKKCFKSEEKHCMQTLTKLKKNVMYQRYQSLEDPLLSPKALP